MSGWCSILMSLVLVTVASATEFRHIGDFLLQSHYKLTGAQMTTIPIKPLAFRVYTDGIHVQVKAEGNEEACTTFEVYRSDGIGRQRQGSGAMEVIPGLQAMSNAGGTIRHLRLTRESMTITTFLGVSDQTSVSYSVAAEPNPEVSIKNPEVPIKPLTPPVPPPDAVVITPP
jgi:hypothetical protein